MLDYAQTLDPAAGVAREVRVLPPDGSAHCLWTIAVDIGTSDLVGPAQDMDLTWVGASGLLRSRTLPRAAGEAVERYALHPRGDALPTGAGLPSAEGGAGWARDAVRASTRTYRATAAGGRAVAVPSAAVDYPPAVGVPTLGFDPSPSGTASGPGRAAAQRSAARELVERDVALRAWWQPAFAARLAPPLDDDRDGSLRALLRAAQDLELVLVALAVPDRPVAVLCLAIDDAAQVVGAGVSLEPDLHLMCVKAVQEALQIRALLVDLAASGSWVRPVPPVRHEEERARFWARPGACADARRWLEQVAPEGAVHVTGNAGWVPTLSDDAFVVDLTPRLPGPVREMGWAVVKAFDPRLQPLRMSDAVGWNVGAQARRDGGDVSLPHPLI